MNPPAAINSSRHTPSKTARSLGKLSRWNAVTIPQYKGSATSREPSTFQNHINFLARYFPGPTTIPLMKWYANFYKDTVKTRIDKGYSLTGQPKELAAMT
jgi:hypothetical protein